MSQTLIPIILIQNTIESDLQQKLETSGVINLLDVLTTGEHTTIPKPEFPVPDVFIVVNIDTMDRGMAVTTGLLLRNAGHQVFTTTSADYEDLLEIMTDAYKHVGSIADKAAPFRTEIIVTRYAMEVLGDVTPIVKYFEAEFLVENDK